MTDIPTIIDVFEINIDWNDLLSHLYENASHSIDERMWTSRTEEEENSSDKTKTYPPVRFIVEQAIIFCKARKNNNRRIDLDDIMSVLSLYGCHVIRGLDKETKKIENEIARVKQE